MALVFAIIRNLHKFFLSFFLSFIPLLIFLAWFMKFDSMVNDINIPDTSLIDF